MNNLNGLYEAILTGKLEQAVSVTKEAVAEGVAPQEIINEHMIKGMEAIGARFEPGQVFASNLLTSARAMCSAFDILKPLVQGKADSYIGRIMIGTVKGGLHDIGKDLVAFMPEGCGSEVISLGVNISSDKFISAALENRTDIICISALLTTAMNYMKKIIDALETSGLRGEVKVIVGGTPVGDASARSINADVYASNTNTAVIVAKELINAC